MVPLKYLSNLWRTLEMSLINCESSLMLACSKVKGDEPVKNDLRMIAR